MSRKKKSKGLPPWLIGLIVLSVATVAYFSLRDNTSDSSLRTVEELNPDLYYDNANSLRGNTYKIDVTIGSSLGNSPSKGRLFSVVTKSTENNTASAILPVLVPLSLGNLTIQKGQHYLMKVKVIENGLLQVEEAKKP
jgi:DNA transposition AAA+ family ATPase